MTLNSQETLKEKYGNELYNQLAYNEAGKVLSEVVNKQIKKNELKKETLIKTCFSFYYSKNYMAAVEMFGYLDKIKELTDEETNCYLDCLLRTKNYQKASGLTGTDYSLIVSNIEKDSVRYKVSEVTFNSGEGDYGAYNNNGVIHFVSNRSEIGHTHKKYVWDGLNYSKSFMFNGEVKLIKSTSSKYHDGLIIIDSINNIVYLTRTEFNKEKKPVVSIWSGSVGFNGEINNLSPILLNSDNHNIGNPSFNEDFTEMIFASDMEGGFGGEDLYISKIVNGKWSEPKNMGRSINTKFNENFPFKKDNVLYFSSNRIKGLGGLDIYSFHEGELKNMGGKVNSSMDDFAFNLSIDSREGYFSSDRKDAVDHIYSVSIKKASGVLYIHPKELFKNRDVVDANVYVIKRSNNDTSEVYSNDKGDYLFDLEENEDYILIAKKKQYELEEPVYLNTMNLGFNDTINSDVFLNKIRYDLNVKTIEKGTGNIVSGVKVDFKDPNTGEIVTVITDENGKSIVDIKNHSTYIAVAKKKGYLDEQAIVKTNDEVIIELDLKMTKIKKNVTFKIENILYDLAKWDLRDESKSELDKLAEFLLVNDNIKIELSSHTDCRSSKKYNVSLSQKRAQSCVDYLIAKGIDKSRIIAKGYGESKLINKCSDGVDCSEEEHQENRRTEIKILSVD